MSKIDANEIWLNPNAQSVRNSYAYSDKSAQDIFATVNMPDENILKESGYSKQEIDLNNDGRADERIYTLVDEETGASTEVLFSVANNGASIFNSATFTSYDENGLKLESQYVDSDNDGTLDEYHEVEYDENNVPYNSYTAEDRNQDGSFDSKTLNVYLEDGKLYYSRSDVDSDNDGEYDSYYDMEYQYENGVLEKQQLFSRRFLNNINSDDTEYPKDRIRIIDTKTDIYFDEARRVISSETATSDSLSGKKVEYSSYSYNEDGSYTVETKTDDKANDFIDSISISGFDSEDNIVFKQSKRDRGDDGFFEIQEEILYKNGKMASGEYRCDKNQDGIVDEKRNTFCYENGEANKIIHEADTDYDGVMDATNTIFYDKEGNLIQRDLEVDANNDGIVDKIEKEIFSDNLISSRTTEVDDDFDGKIDATTYRYYEDGELVGGEHFEDYKMDKQIGSFKQGRNGDCWFLAGINALKNTAQGRQIIENAIEINDDGTYTVNFDGVAKSYTITQDDLNQTRINDFASGDDDVLLLETAAIKFFEENPDFLKQISPHRFEYSQDNINPMLDGGNFEYITYLFLGENATRTTNNTQENEFLNMYEQNQANISAEISFQGGDEENPYTMLDINGNEIRLGNQHAWTLKSIDGEEVTMVNPWNSDEEVVVYKDDLIEKADNFTYKEFPKEENSGGIFLKLINILSMFFFKKELS